VIKVASLVSVLTLAGLSLAGIACQIRLIAPSKPLATRLAGKAVFLSAGPSNCRAEPDRGAPELVSSSRRPVSPGTTVTRTEKLASLQASPESRVTFDNRDLRKSGRQLVQHAIVRRVDRSITET
jgi:hypothetical protein